MTLKATILSLVALLATVLQHVHAADALRTPSHDQPEIVLKISDLRSAYLQRAGVVSYDESKRTSEGLRRQVQRHFDVVLSLLSFATSDSSEIGVVRLEAADDHSWTAEERTAWRRKLLAARHVQLERLAAYRDRGVFPLNEGQSAHSAPILVDRHGTDCAVGHLMRVSGWADEVDAISQSDNLVYVPDATQSAIAQWVLTSGLTLQEAALIQPGYYWPVTQIDASAYEPGELALERDGLRYSNFRLQAQNLFGNTAALPTLAGLGLTVGMGTYNPNGFPRHTPIGTHWIAIGGTQDFGQSPPPPLHSLRASAAAGQTPSTAVAQLVVVKFGVAPIAADQRISGISESNYRYWQGFQDTNPFGSGDPPATAIYYLKTTAFNGPTALASLNIDQLTPGTYFARQSDTKSFAARQQISVEARVYLDNGVKMDAFVLDFNVVTVPEPTSGFLGAVLIAACGLRRTRGRIAVSRDYQNH